MRRLECKCCGEAGHEPHCPVWLRHNYCDDCGQAWCRCTTVYRPIDPTFDPWKETA